MQRFFQINEQGYIITTTDAEFPQGGQALFEFPEEFDFEKQCFYKIIDGELVYDTAAELAAQTQQQNEQELAELYEWFTWYDLQVAQYARCVRLSEPFDRDIAALDAEAVIKQARIRELRGGTDVLE